MIVLHELNALRLSVPEVHTKVQVPVSSAQLLLMCQEVQVLVIAQSLLMCQEPSILTSVPKLQFLKVRYFCILFDQLCSQINVSVKVVLC